MKRLVNPFFKIICFCIVFAGIVSVSEACRFYAAVGERIPQEKIIQDFLEADSALIQLSEDNADGWSVSYYDEAEAIHVRGHLSAHKDEKYLFAVNDAAKQEPSIVTGHLRAASSGCVDGVPNPHPFTREWNDKTWIFGHNGGMRKQVLIDLIGEEYLKTNSPQVCDFNPPDSWIDSELYFIFTLKEIAAHDQDVIAGLTSALQKLYAVLPEDRRYLNFFLSNGEDVWVFRKGNSLFWQFDTSTQITTIASTIPDTQADNWQEVPEDTIVHISEQAQPQFYELFAVEYAFHE